MEKQPYGVLIVHGFASSLDSVSGIEPSFKALGIATRMPALCGHNEASPEALRGVKWPDWVADGEAALQDLLKEAQKAIIVGHSMGGLVALTLAADHPDVVDSIVLAAAAARLASPLASGGSLHLLVPLVLRLFKKWDLPPVYADKTLAQSDTNYHWAPIDAIARVPEYAGLPWFAYTGYMGERLFTCFAHGVLTAVLVTGIKRGGCHILYGLLSALGLHLLLNTPAALYQFKLIPLELYNISFMVPFIVLAVIFERMRRVAREPVDDLYSREVIYWQRQITK